MIPPILFCSKRKPIDLSQTSVSKAYCHLLFGRVNTGGEVSFSSSASSTFSSSSVNSPGSLDYHLRSGLKSVEPILSILGMNFLNTLQCLRTYLKSFTVVGTCNLQMTSTVSFAT